MMRIVNVWSSALVALCLATAMGPVASARPPDLPAPGEQECQPECPAQHCPVEGTLPTNVEATAEPAIDELSGECDSGSESAAPGCATGGFCQALIQLFSSDETADANTGPITRLFQAVGVVHQPLAWRIQLAETPAEPMPAACMPCGAMTGCAAASVWMGGGMSPTGTAVPACCGSGRVTFGQPMSMPMPGCPFQMEMSPAAAANTVMPGETLETLKHLMAARQLYQVAEFYLRTGHPQAARFYYEQAHLHSPLSRCGQVSLLKLTQIEFQMVNSAIAEQQAASHAVDQSSAEGEASSTPNRVPSANERYLQQLAQAQYMYHVGERCRSRGDLDKAYTCYHQAQRLCPDSDYARLAAQNIRRIDVLRQVQEAQNDADNTTASTEEESTPTTQQTEEPADEEMVPFFANLFGIPTPEFSEEFSDLDQPNEAAPACPVSEDFGDFPMTESSQSAPDQPADHCGCRTMRGLSQRTCRQGCASEECQRERLARAVETSAWLLEILNVLGGGNTRVDLDVDNSENRGLRVRGGFYLGGFGCQVIREGDDCRVVWPAAPGQ